MTGDLGWTLLLLVDAGLLVLACIAIVALFLRDLHKYGLDGPAKQDEGGK